MKRRGIVLVLVPAILLLGSPVFASTTAELLKVLATLTRIHQVTRNIRGVTEDIRHKLTRVWPDRALRPLQIVMEPVRSIRSEISQLSCGWQFSVRTEALRAGIFAGRGFCKREWEAVFGPVPQTRFRDMDEYNDWSAVRRLNAVSRHVTQNDAWTQQATWLTAEALRGTLNPAEDQGRDGRPGYAQRLSALGAAQLGNFLAEGGKLQAYELELAQERLNERRHRQRLQQTFAVFSYGLLGGSPSTSMADSGPELPAVLQ
jgi:hypothetical protein